jgi:uncharacterized protein
MSLFDAIEAKNLNQIRKFVKRVDDLDKIDYEYESTPLIYAIEHGNAEIIAELLNAGASPSANGIADTPLTAAVGASQVSTLNLLLEAGADVNVPIEDGITPLMCAASSNCLRCVELLVEAGARINDIDSDGETAYDKARGDVRTYLKNLINDG